ncbi:MAG: heme-degrading domain-containing protein [Alphaproteobacteria bacterium]|nr:heme-degrading domain-containing protein [Alphaproteobacteria bacterium]
MSLDDDLVRLKLQEQLLQFTKFDESDAWELGSAMREAALERKHPFVIDIRCAGRKLFFAALPGSAPENESWVQRKINATQRFHQSTYHIGRVLEKRGLKLDENMGVAAIEMAAAGGCFPIIIKNVGVVGTITVSGIPQREDHNFVVEAVAAHLNIPLASVALSDCQ